MRAERNFTLSYVISRWKLIRKDKEKFHSARKIPSSGKSALGERVPVVGQIFSHSAEEAQLAKSGKRYLHAVLQLDCSFILRTNCHQGKPIFFIVGMIMQSIKNLKAVEYIVPSMNE